MEGHLDNNNKNITIDKKDDDTSSSFLSQPSSNSLSPTLGTTKINHVVLHSATWAAKIKIEIKLYTLIFQMVIT
jgi:hypothetical protein